MAASSILARRASCLLEKRSSGPLVWFMPYETIRRPSETFRHPSARPARGSSGQRSSGCRFRRRPASESPPARRAAWGSARQHHEGQEEAEQRDGSGVVSRLSPSRIRVRRCGAAMLRHIETTAGDGCGDDRAQHRAGHQRQRGEGRQRKADGEGCDRHGEHRHDEDRNSPRPSGAGSALARPGTGAPAAGDKVRRWR